MDSALLLLAGAIFLCITFFPRVCFLHPHLNFFLGRSQILQSFVFASKFCLFFLGGSQIVHSA